MSCLSTILQNNGVVGAGGAGFPTYAKLNQNKNIIIVNVADCEPLLNLHRQLLVKNTNLIIETLLYLKNSLNAKKVIIGIKSKYSLDIKTLEQCLQSCLDIEICKLNNVYPAGDELHLIFKATNIVVPAGELPSKFGIVVLNLETVFNIANALSGRPVTHKLVSIVGEVQNPITCFFPIGMNAKDCLKLAIPKIKDYSVLLGGVMMGKLANENSVITKTTNAILVLDKLNKAVLLKQANPKIQAERAGGSCHNCTLCTNCCPRNLLGHKVLPHLAMKASLLKDNLNINDFAWSYNCSGCGVCEMFACPHGLSPKNVIASFKEQLIAQGIKREININISNADDALEQKSLPISRLMANLGLKNYEEPTFCEHKIVANNVSIYLNSHIGNKSLAIVKVGDSVVENQLIAKNSQGLSVCQHSPIAGVVTAVNENYIRIESK